MKTETVDITELNKGDKVALLGREFTIEKFERIIDFNLNLSEVGGLNFMELFDIEPGTVFKKVVPDLEEFRVRSAVDKEFYLDFFERAGHLTIYMYNPYTGNHSMTLDKADLKAVVEKL